MGDLSAHFSTSEFKCRHCGRVLVQPRLVERLERLRSAIQRPIYIVSGYRCPAHNAAVGGASRSQHLLGKAADIQPGIATVQQALAAGFNGVGYRGIHAVHVDVRAGPPVTFVD